MVADARWVLAVDVGTSTTRGSVAHVNPDDGWLHVDAVTVDGATAVPSVVLSRPDGSVLAGRPALDAAPSDPAAAVLRARSYLASADGSPDAVITSWPRPTTAVDVATALVARVLHAEAGRRRTLPTSLVLTHPGWWGEPARDALRRAGVAVLAAVPHASPDMVVLLPAPEAAAVRLGGHGPVVVVDVGGGGTEVAVVDREAGAARATGGEGEGEGGAGTGDTRATLRAGSRSVEVGAETLDDALARTVLDRARPELAARVRTGYDLEAHRVWFTLRREVQAGKERLGATGAVDVTVPVVVPENPRPTTVRLTHDDLGTLFAPGLEIVAAAVLEVVGDERIPVLVRGGVTDLPGVRDWLADARGAPWPGPTTPAPPPPPAWCAARRRGRRPGRASAAEPDRPAEVSAVRPC